MLQTKLKCSQPILVDNCTVTAPSGWLKAHIRQPLNSKLLVCEKLFQNPRQWSERLEWNHFVTDKRARERMYVQTAQDVVGKALAFHRCVPVRSQVSAYGMAMVAESDRMFTQPLTHLRVSIPTTCHAFPPKTKHTGNSPVEDVCIARVIMLIVYGRTFKASQPYLRLSALSVSFSYWSI